MKLCECGCGQQIAHRRFVHGHNQRRDAVLRFWEKVVIGEPCWIWIAHKNKNGYGYMGISNKLVLVHRFSYELRFGLIPAGLTIDHLCRNRACVNPHHMETVSNRENILRGESPPAKMARATHCINGHAFTTENTYLTKRGHRDCRACHRKRQREYNRKESCVAS